MIPLTRSIFKLAGLVFLSLMTPILHAQNFQFRTYSTDQGLCGRFVYTINEDNLGYLWMGTGSGICRFDGVTFQTNVIPDSLNESMFLTSYKDSLGSIWFGSNDGIILQYDVSGTRVFNVQKYTSGPVNGFIEDIDGSIIAATQNNGLLKIQRGETSGVVPLGIDKELIFSVGKTSQGRLLLGTNRGLFLYSFPKGNQPPQLIRKIDEIPETTIQVICPGTEHIIFIGTSDQGIFRINTSDDPNLFKITSLSGGSEIAKVNSQSIFFDNQQQLWVSTLRAGLIKVLNPMKADQSTLKVEWFNYENGLGTNGTKTVFQDFEGNIWVGTSGKGLKMLIDEAFSFHSFEASAPGNSIYAITADDQHYYFGGDYGVAVMNKTDHKIVRVIGKKEGLPIDKINALYFDPQDVLWIGTEMNGLYWVNTIGHKVHPYFVSGNDLERSVQFITGYNSKLWVATKNGIFLFDRITNEKKHFSTNTGLPYNNISNLFLDRQYNLWFSTTTNELNIITPDLELKRSNYPPPPRSVEMRGIILDSNNEVWAATYGNGVLHFTTDSVFIINSQSGLKSDYCYSIKEGPEGKIWVGHRQGFSVISEKEKFIQTYGREKGIRGDANSNSIFLDKNGKLILGTSDGIVIYNSDKAHSKTVPPKIILSSLRMNNKIIPLSDKIIMPFARYEMKIDYTGLSFIDPERINYRYKLENYDAEWSAVGPSRQAVYKRLEDGIYAFKVVAINSDYVVSSSQATFILIIRKPIWKTWWFIGLMVLSLVVLIVIIIKIRERNHRKLEEYLQTELTERTKEVVEKKEEIELKNKEITDSINYAQRIQASILPPTQKLIDVFPESFVYYQPRDIVSGDFYWWDRINKDRFLIVCADSTGHGVPGAFMSMIGSTLIKDIVGSDPDIRPSGLLRTLDHEITQSLNQNIGVNASNDGMDIIVCEFNIKSNHMIFASAMRPIIMYHKGEQYYIRGNRSSIGGEIYADKIFEDQEYHLVKGDVVYLFSDGYPDQFGGPNGKKLKMVRLKNLLEDIHERNMQDQFQHIKQNFEIWRDGFEQVDDVLFMGIQI